MERILDKNNIFSLKLFFFNIEILFELEKGNYIINKNKPFDPLLNLSKDIEKIKNYLKSNPQDILYFLYFNMYNIERILYNKDEIINFDFDDKNNNYFLKITQEKIEIEKTNEIVFLFYISLLLKYNINVINFSFSFGFINKINSINTSDKNNIYKKLLISKIILELINYYNSNQIFEEKNNKEEIEKLKKDNNKIIENFYNEFEKIGLTINQEDFKLKNIDLIYSKIIIVLLESKDFDLSYKIIEELDLENIYLTKEMLIEISKTLFSNESFINKYILTSFDDLFDPKKVNFYYILFKYILKNSIYIYYLNFLNDTRNNIIIKMEEIQYLLNNNNRTLDNNFKNKVIYIINFFANSKYYMKYINLNDSNLNSNLNISYESSQSSFIPFENLSFKEEKEKSQREFSNFQNNQSKYYISSSEISDYTRFCTFLFPSLHENEKSKEIFSYYITKRKKNLDETIKFASNGIIFEGKTIKKIKNWIEKTDEKDDKIIKNSKKLLKGLINWEKLIEKINEDFEIELEFMFKREKDLSNEIFYNISYECYHIKKEIKESEKKNETEETEVSEEKIYETRKEKKSEISNALNINNGMNIENIISEIRKPIKKENNEIIKERSIISFYFNEDAKKINESHKIINKEMKIDENLYELLISNITDFQVEHICLLNISDEITRNNSNSIEKNNINENPNNNDFSKNNYFILGGYDLKENKPKVKLFQILPDGNKNEGKGQMKVENINGIRLLELYDEVLSNLEFKSNIISIHQNEREITILTKDSEYYLSYHINDI